VKSSYSVKHGIPPWGPKSHRSLALERAGAFVRVGGWKSLLLIDASYPSAMGEYGTLFENELTLFGTPPSQTFVWPPKTR
jgi:hypothetical protein